MPARNNATVIVSDKADTPSLDEFAATRQSKSGYPSWVDSLPDEIQAQILSSSAGHSVVVDWLHGLGHTRATQNIVGNWRRRRGWTP
jgi:hypothetical protein